MQMAISNSVEDYLVNSFNGNTATTTDIAINIIHALDADIVYNLLHSTMMDRTKIQYSRMPSASL